jgi:hypothetical protein
MNVPQPSVAAQVLQVIEASSAPLDTSQIYAVVEDATNMTHISVTCRDLYLAGKIDRFERGGRHVYRARQPDLLGAPPVDDEAAELARTLDTPPANASPTPQKRARHARERGIPTIDKTLKLRTIDKLIALVAEDIGAVLAAVRQDVERTA